MAPTAGALHGPAGSPGAQPRGGAERAAGRPGPAVRRGHPAHPPRPRRCPRDRRRPARAHRASRQPGCAHLRRTALLPAGRDAGPAPQASARRGPAAPAGGLPVPRAVGRGALHRHRRRPAPPGRSVLHRRRPPRPDEGDGRAGRDRRPRRVRPRVGGRRARAAAAGRARAAVQSPVEVSPPLVVGDADRRVVPAAGGGAGAATRPRHRPLPFSHRRRRRGRVAGALHRPAHLHRAAGALGVARTGLSRTRSVALPRSPQRDGHPVRGGRRAGRGLDRGNGQQRPGRRGRPGHRARRTPSLRERGAAAGPDRHRRGGPVARPAAAGPGRPAGTGGRRSRSRRAAITSPSSGTASSPAPAPPSAACRRCRWSTRYAAGAQAILPAPAPLGGALVEETALVARWLATPGVRIVRVADTGFDGWASPLRSAGAWAAWAASARSARLAGEQLDRAWESDLLAEPHPTREQVFGRTGVDGGGGAPQAVLPRRQPFSAAG